VTGLDDEAARLARRVATVKDPQLRVAYVRSLLLEAAAPEVFALIVEVAGRAAVGDPAHRDLWLAMAVALADPACRALRAGAADRARGLGDVELATLLEAGRDEAVDEDARRVPTQGGRDGRPLTLGERKSLARRPSRDLLAKVLRDPHPDVVRILLGNPRLTEDDLVRLCARRPIAPEVLREVARSPRWVVRYRVRVAILRHPHTPLDLALPLVAGLNAQDARTIAASEGLPRALRDACARLGPPETLH
jgi:hypothetical protein